MAHDNFRANFLGKISVGGVEYGESLSAEAARRLLKTQILDETSDVDVDKLAQFVAKHPVAPCYRVGVWKLLLGISAPFVEGRHIVAQHRMEEAQLLLRSLQVIGKTLSSDYPESSQHYVIAMIKLADPSTSISSLSCAVPISLAEMSLDYIAKSVIPLCLDSENSLVDAYWLTRSIYELIANTFDDSHVLKASVDEMKTHINDLKTTTIISGDLCNHFDDQNLRLWFLTGGAALLCPDALQRLWDLLCAGQSVDVLLRYALIELINLVVQTPAKTMNDNLQSRDIQNKSVTAAIEKYVKIGSMNTRKV